MLIAVPDLVTNSYFPALAAEELGFYRTEGVDAHVELLAPALGAMAALRDGRVQGVVTGVHTTLTAFPGWKGAKVAVAVAQGTPWLLVLRADRPAARGDIEAALLKATLPAGNPVGQKRNPVVACSHHSGQKTEAPKILKSWGLCGCGG